MKGEEAIKGIRRIIGDGCAEPCEGCPFNVPENNRECANFIVKCVLEGDWSGFVNMDDGMVEREYEED